MKGRILLAAALTALILVSVSADEMPKLPDNYVGYAVINGELALEDTNVLVEVASTGEVVANTTVDGNGRFLVEIRFSESSEANNITDGLVQDGDTLTWGVDYIATDYPSPGSTEASSGELHTLYFLSRGYPYVMVVESIPESSTPSVVEGSSLAFSVGVVAPFRDLIEYNWTLDGVTQSTSSSWTYSPGYTESGEKSVVLYVSDGVSSDNKSWTLTVQEVCDGVGPPQEGNWTVTGNTSCVNANISLVNRDLVLKDGSTLELDNVVIDLTNSTIILDDSGGDITLSILDSIWDTLIEWIT